jgi:hypothetical protein
MQTIPQIGSSPPPVPPDDDSILAVWQRRLILAGISPGTALQLVARVQAVTAQLPGAISESQSRVLGEAILDGFIEAGLGLVSRGDLSEIAPVDIEAYYLPDRMREFRAKVSAAVAIKAQGLAGLAGVQTETEYIRDQTAAIGQLVSRLEEAALAVERQAPAAPAPAVLGQVTIADDGLIRLRTNLQNRWRTVLAQLRRRGFWVVAWDENGRRELDFDATAVWFSSVTRYVATLLPDDDPEAAVIRGQWQEAWVELDPRLKANLAGMRWNPNLG